MKQLTLWLILFINLTGFSQIVNIENKRLSNHNEGFNGSAEFNFNFTMNSKQLLQVGDRIRVSYVKQRHHFLVVTDHSFIKSEGSDFVNRGFEHFRYHYAITDSGRISLEVFQQGQFNKIQKINLRLLFGTGLRFNLIDLNNYQLNFGTGLMREYEELIELGVSQDLLSTSYVSFDGQFNESIGLNTISYFQPKLIDFGNYRFSNETALRFKINRYLTFKLVYSLTHDSRNIPGVRKTNYLVKNTVKFQF